MIPSAFSKCFRTRLTCLGILIILPTLIYFNSLQGSFNFDDRGLLEKEWLTNLEAYQENVHLGAFENRSLLLLTYALNNELHRGPPTQHPIELRDARLDSRDLVRLDLGQAPRRGCTAPRHEPSGVSHTLARDLKRSITPNRFLDQTVPGPTLRAPPEPTRLLGGAFATRINGSQFRHGGRV